MNDEPIPSVREAAMSYLDTASKLIPSVPIPETPGSCVGATLGALCGVVGGALLRMSDNTIALAERRSVWLLAVVADRHREKLAGKGYLFRIDPNHYQAGWPDADRQEVDFLARILRAALMELGDLMKNDQTAYDAAKKTMGLTIRALAPS